MAGKANYPKSSIPMNCSPSSMVTQIAELKEHQTCTRVVEIQDDVTVKEVSENMRMWKRRLTSSIQSSIKYARSRIGGKKAEQRRFSIETCHFMTQNARVVLSVTVKRESDYVDL